MRYWWYCLNCGERKYTEDVWCCKAPKVLPIGWICELLRNSWLQARPLFVYPRVTYRG